MIAEVSHGINIDPRSFVGRADQKSVVDDTLHVIQSNLNTLMAFDMAADSLELDDLTDDPAVRAHALDLITRTLTARGIDVARAAALGGCDAAAGAMAPVWPACSFTTERHGDTEEGQQRCSRARGDLTSARGDNFTAHLTPPCALCPPWFHAVGVTIVATPPAPDRAGRAAPRHYRCPYVACAPCLRRKCRSRSGAGSGRAFGDSVSV